MLQDITLPNVDKFKRFLGFTNPNITKYSDEQGQCFRILHGFIYKAKKQNMVLMRTATPNYNFNALFLR